MLKFCLVACPFIFIFVICLVPAIVWLVYGNKFKDDPCTIDATTPDMATWLIVNGAAEIGNFFFMLVCLAGGGLFALGAKCAGGVLGGIAAFIFVLNCLFLLAWTIVGIVILAQDGGDNCKEENSTLWVVTLVAVILNFLGVGGYVCSGGSGRAVFQD